MQGVASKNNLNENKLQIIRHLKKTSNIYAQIYGKIYENKILIVFIKAEKIIIIVCRMFVPEQIRTKCQSKKWAQTRRTTSIKFDQNQHQDQHQNRHQNQHQNQQNNPDNQHRH
jgi:hypothetical protein